MFHRLKKMIFGGCFCLTAFAFYTGTIQAEAAVQDPTTIETTEAAEEVTTEATTEAVKVTVKVEDKKTSLRKNMVSYAKKFLGNRYVYGGTSLTKGTDCSGFTMRIYQKFGYRIPRTSRAQASASKKISSREMKQGDLIFYGSGKRVSHVAMYIGNGKVIHASNRKDGIKISKWNYRTPIKIGRFIK